MAKLYRVVFYGDVLERGEMLRQTRFFNEKIDYEVFLSSLEAGDVITHGEVETLNQRTEP